MEDTTGKKLEKSEAPFFVQGSDGEDMPDAIRFFHPYALDVSVRSDKWKKRSRKIKRFIERVKHGIQH